MSLCQLFFDILDLFHIVYQTIKFLVVGAFEQNQRIFEMFFHSLAPTIVKFSEQGFIIIVQDIFIIYYQFIVLYKPTLLFLLFIHILYLPLYQCLVTKAQTIEQILVLGHCQSADLTRMAFQKPATVLLQLFIVSKKVNKAISIPTYEQFYIAAYYEWNVLILAFLFLRIINIPDRTFDLFVF